ncbi:hypothetical protein [Viridibacillus arvi]|uniref:hypothetical protein n=1 Tax=Viridibacillus arvi TaxID=263475 RepID=UPI0034CD9C66
MYLDDIFKKIKEQVTLEISSVQNTDDFMKFCEWLEPHRIMIEQINILGSISTCSSASTKFGKEVQQLESNSQIITENETNIDFTEEVLVDEGVEDLEEVQNYPVGFEFSFSKRAYGGILDHLQYVIPEELVRKLQLESGYKIKIIGKSGHFQNGEPRYNFKVSDVSTRCDNELLCEIEQGIVESNGNSFFITKTIHGEHLVEGKPAKCNIVHKDVVRLGIQEGDIINGRFYSNNITKSFRATYKYDTDYIKQSKSIEEMRLAHRKNNKDDTESLGLAMMDRIDTAPYRNKQILLIGLASRMTDFKEMLKGKEDVSLEHMTGDETKSFIRSQISKADIVLLSTQENSHDTTKYVASVCNELDVPFRSSHADGLFSILLDTKELLDKQPI